MMDDYDLVTYAAGVKTYMRLRWSTYRLDLDDLAYSYTLLTDITVFDLSCCSNILPSFFRVC